MSVTITEALAELKTIEKRLESKRGFVENFLLRDNRVVDPLVKDGGSEDAIRREMQSIRDLEERKVAIRRAIADANANTTISVNGSARTIADWLTWRRDVAPGTRTFYARIRSHIQNARQTATKAGQATTTPGQEGKPGDIIVHLNEQELHRQSEALEDTLGVLDGQLSLKNATIVVDY